MQNMQEPPKMISTKDLSYIEDMFNWNFTACKKAHCYKEKVQDEEIKQFLENISSMHKTICQNLINILGGNYE